MCQHRLLSSPHSCVLRLETQTVRLIFFRLTNKHPTEHSLMVGRTIPSVAVEFGSILTAQPAVLHAGEGATTDTALTL